MQKDKEVLEKVQRRATRTIRGFGALAYEERLEKCGMTTLDKRKCRADLTETCKMMTNKKHLSRDFSSWLTEVDYEGTDIRSSGSQKEDSSNDSLAANAWNKLSDD